MTLTTVQTDLSDTPPGSVTWLDVCAHDELDAERGSAVLIGGQQVALFRLASVRPLDAAFPVVPELYAVGNRDPYCGANVLARGIVGSVGATVYVASPMYKQRFDLRTGQCLDDEAVVIPAWPVRAVDGRVELSLGVQHGR